MKRSGLIVAAYLFLTFGSGAAVGALGFWLYTTRSVSASTQRFSPEEYRQRYLQEMETRLNLSPDQLQKLNTILDATRALYREVADKHKPEFEAIQQHQIAQVRAILKPEQQAAYKEFLAEREKKKKKKHHF
ncbi:MAG: hypothetical protein FJW20_07465 [Acidimicrobiia bacterium]|nr:hypothetical protein [Acidimicrobiia bacterium]